MIRPLVRDEKGVTLVATLIILIVVTIFGATIMGVTTANFRMAKLDSKSQSAYYIAEAGVHYIVDRINTEIKENSGTFKNSADFFQHIEDLFVNEPITIYDFERNAGDQPRAVISLNPVFVGDDTREYRISSIGEIGKSKRTATSTISIDWKDTSISDIVDDLLFYASYFSFLGSSVNAVSGGIIMDGLETHDINGGAHVNVSNLYFNGPVKIDGGSASFGSPEEPGKILVNGDLDLWEGGRAVYGEIRVEGNFRLKDARIFGDVYVNGDVELDWTPEIHNNIYYTGNLKVPANYPADLLAKVIKVDSVESFEIPKVDYSLREDSWYQENGYVFRGHETGVLAPNVKMVVDSYHNTQWQETRNLGQVVIVSKGDIVLRGGDGFTGALIAPNGKVEYSGDGTFNGVIIAKEIQLPQGGSHFNLKHLSEMFGDDIPILAHQYSDEEGSGGDSQIIPEVSLTIRSRIREE